MLESKINKDIIANDRQKSVDSDEEQKRRVFSKVLLLAHQFLESLEI